MVALQAGFLKSSPKVILFPKRQQQSSGRIQTTAAFNLSLPGGLSSATRTFSPKPTVPAQPHTPAHTPRTWICPICSFSNSLPPDFDLSNANTTRQAPPCTACGVVPPLATSLKAVISQASEQESGVSTPYWSQQTKEADGDGDSNTRVGPASHTGDSRNTGHSLPTTQCPRCTFINHPSLSICEICGAPLSSSSDGVGEYSGVNVPMGFRTDSPGPSLLSTGFSGAEVPECIKFSFRAGGDRTFHERLKGALIQRKWLLQGAPPVPKPDTLSLTPAENDSFHDQLRGSTSSSPLPRHKKTVGLAGLEQRDLNVRKNNELVIGNAFEDLDALISSAKDIIALAEKFSGTLNTTSASSSPEARALLSQSAAAMGLVATKDMLGSGSSSESLYLSELSRNLAEFLTDDSVGILHREGGIMSLVDLWAVFNRARGGVELISPLDFQKAANMWETLHLPLRLRRFKSGVLVVQGKDRSDEKTIASLVNWLRQLQEVPPAEHVPWDWHSFGRGVTPQETAEKFGWSVGVANEELEMAEEKGALCREEGLEGLRFWRNYLQAE